VSAPAATQAAERTGYVLHVISHTHWDREWYLTFQRFRMRLVRLIDDLLDILDRDPHFRAFHLDGQAVVLEDYLEVRPEQEERLRRHVRQGRILIGPWYVLPDEFLVSGEALVRNLLTGRRVCARFGPPMPVGYLPDLFGHVSQMPQLLRDAGFDNAVIWRGLSGEREGLKSELWWEAPDGSRVLALHLPERYGYGNAANLPTDPAAALERIVRLKHALAAVATTPHLLLMNGVDHHPAQPEIPALIEALNRQLEDAQVVHSTLPEYVEAVRRGIGELQVRRGELREVNRSGTPYPNYLLYGVASARVYLKQWNHRCQQELERYAEPLAALAWILGEPYPHGFLRQSWTYLLQNHPHDSICGCSIDPVHEQMLTRFQWSHEIAQQVATEALHQITKRIDRSSLPAGRPVLHVFNPLPWNRSDLVEAAVDLPPESQARGFIVRAADGTIVPHSVRDDRRVVKTLDHSDLVPVPRHVSVREVRLAFVAEAPGTGYSTYTVEPTDLPVGPTGQAIVRGGILRGLDTLENEHLRVTVRPNGTFDVLDKATGRTFDGLLCFEDGGDVGDEYTFAPPQQDRIVTSLGAQAQIEVVEDSAAVATLRIALSLRVPESATEDRLSRSSRLVDIPIESLVSLAAGARHVDVTTTVTNTARDHRLRVLFPAGLLTETHYADSAFDVVERPNRYPAPPLDVWNEDPPETHPQRLFVDLSDGEAGLAIFNAGIAEYGIIPCVNGGSGIALTLLRCVAYLGAATYARTIRRGAGPHLPTPGAQCSGTHVFRYAIRPHAGTWEYADLVRAANEWTVPLRCYQAEDAAAAGRAAGYPGSLPLRRAFLWVEGNHVIVSAVKKCEDRDTLIVRLYNPSTQGSRGRLCLYEGIAAAWQASILEERRDAVPVAADGSVAFDLPAKKIMTLEVQPRRPGS
jgi:alpha-mannosidase